SKVRAIPCRHRDVAWQSPFPIYETERVASLHRPPCYYTPPASKGHRPHACPREPSCLPTAPKGEPPPPIPPFPAATSNAQKLLPPDAIRLLPTLSPSRPEVASPRETASSVSERSSPNATHSAQATACSERDTKRHSPRTSASHRRAAYRRDS